MVTSNFLETVYYDSKSKRYKYKGNQRFVSREVVTQLIDRKIEEEKFNMRTFASKIQRKEIGSYTDLANTLKKIHILEVAKAKGGFEKITDSDLGVIGSILKKQYYQGKDKETGKKYGLKFLIEESVTQSTVLVENRLGMYGESGKLSAFSVIQNDAKSKGKTLMKRILGVTDFHCGDCLRYASLGFQKIGELPLPTQACSCFTNCKCSVVYE